MIVSLNKIKRALNIESLAEQLEKYKAFEKAYAEAETNLDKLAEDFQFEKSLFMKRINAPENSDFKDKIQKRFDNFLTIQKEEIKKAKSNFNDLKKQKELFESDPKISKALADIRKSEAYERIKKAYKEGKITPESFNTILNSVTKSDVTKYADFILYNEKGQILLLKRSAWEDDNKGAWVIPGGHVDPGEDFETAAKRELREESGFNVDKCVNVGQYKDNKAHIEYFSGSINTKENEAILDVFESRDLRWINLDEIYDYEMVFNMKDNLLKILNLPEQSKTLIRKNRRENILGKYGEEVLDLIESVLKEEVGKSELDSLYEEYDFELQKSKAKYRFLIEKGFFKEAQIIADEIEKAGKDISKLTKIKKLVYRDGKLVRGTYYVKTGEFEETKERRGGAGIITSDVSEGDAVELSTKRKSMSGVVTGFSIHEDGKAYISIRDDKDELAWFSVDSLIKYKKGTEAEKEKLEREVVSSESIPDFKDLSYVRELGGSSGVKLYTSYGVEYAVKTPHKGELSQIEQEKRINDLYRDFGFETPVSKIDKESEKMISEFIVGAKELNSVTLTPTLKKEIQKGFVLDCLLANWDVIGANKDNILIKDGKVIRVDNGGTLSTRAKGGSKVLTSEVSELKSMKEYGYGSEVFGSVTDDDIREQVKTISKKKKLILDAVKQVSPSDYDVMERRIGWLETNYIKKGAEEKVETKKEEPKEKLRAGMPSLLTQRYFDNEFAKVNLEGNKGIKEHIAAKIVEFEKKWDSKYESIASHKGITKDQVKQNMQRWITDIINRSHGYIVAHSSVSGRKGIVGLVLSEGRFKTQFETGSSMGSLAPDYRDTTERGFYGFDKKVDYPSMRPIYGFFTDNKHGAINSDGTVPPPRRVAQYGDICFEVKDSKWRKDATFTMGDSLGDHTSYVSPPVGAPHFTAVKPNYYDELEEMAKGKVGSGLYGSYVESQYHNQLKLEDIEKIHVSAKSPGSYGERKEPDLESLSKVVNEINASTLKGGKLIPIEIF